MKLNGLVLTVAALSTVLTARLVASDHVYTQIETGEIISSGFEEVPPDSSQHLRASVNGANIMWVDGNDLAGVTSWMPESTGAT